MLVKCKAGQSSLLSMIVVASIVLASGIGLWSFTASTTQILRLSEIEELNDEVMVLRNHLSADYVFYPGGEAMLRNTGREDLVVFRMVVYRNGTLVWDSGIRGLATLRAGETAALRFSCPGCMAGDPILLVVHYIPEELFNPEDPRLIEPLSDVLIYEVASFPAERPLSSVGGGLCQLPEKWAFIDFVDPIEKGWRNRLTRNIKIRLPEASERDNIKIRMVVKELWSGRVGEDERVVLSESPGERVFHLDRSNLRYPLQVEVTATTEDWAVIQGEWVMGIDGSIWNPRARLDYVKLLWNRSNKYVVEAFVKVFYRVSGTYRLSVTLYDCNGNQIASGSLDVEVEVKGGLWDEQSILIEPQVSMFDVYRVEVEVNRL